MKATNPALLEIIETFARRDGHRTTVNGNPVVATNNEPLLLQAFAVLGWADP